MYDSYIRRAAEAMAQTMSGAKVPMYGARVRLPERKAIEDLLREMRKLMFPAYFGDAALMTLDAADYAALLLERIETALQRQIALALPEEEIDRSSATAREVVEQLPRIQQQLLTDVDAFFEGDPAAQNKEEVIFAYPGLFAIFVYRIAHELFLRHVPIIPRIMTEYAHSRTGIDIHPGAQIGRYFFIDHGTGVVIGETTTIGQHVKLYQHVTLGAKSFEVGEDGILVKGVKRHPDIGNHVTIYTGACILGGTTKVGDGSVIGAQVWLTHSVGENETVTIKNVHQKR